MMKGIDHKTPNSLIYGNCNYIDITLVNQTGHDHKVIPPIVCYFYEPGYN